MKDEFDDLFHISEEEYGENYSKFLMEQYKQFLQMIDNLTQRRTLANSFFLTVNTGLLAVFGFLTQMENPSFNGLLVFGGAIAGIVFSYSWYRIVKSFKQLSATKWKIVLELEKKLPVKLHETEWKMLGEGKDGKKYRQLTGVEQGVPFVFIMIYVSIIVFALSSIS